MYIHKRVFKVLTGAVPLASGTAVPLPSGTAIQGHDLLPLLGEPGEMRLDINVHT